MKKHFVICGAAPDTGNLGVSALGNAAVSGLYSADNNCDFTVLDSQKGIREFYYCTGSSEKLIKLCGAKHSKKIYQKESIKNISFFAKFIPSMNSISTHLLSATAFLDVSGGDSFTDLYGDFRFDWVNAPKKFALDNNIPLVMLPQTYGPFIKDSTKAKASEIVKKAKLAWARDAHSYAILKDLLGDSFDSARHKVGVDMAFILPTKKSLKKITPTIQNWLLDDGAQLVGINISGLIYNDPESAKNHYKFKTSYNDAIERIVKRILDESAARIVLLPHVLTPPGHYESDYQASLNLVQKLGLDKSDRISIQDPTLDQCEIKWLISQMDWFMGTRMHATIAALSTETPVCTISYSDKALGVFETCGVGNCVIDPRELGTDEVVQATIESMNDRALTKSLLEKNLPAVKKLAYQQMEEILNML